MTQWKLAIDFGTSYSVAASKIDDRAPEVIEIAGERRTPSVVMIDDGGRILVGRTAEDLSGAHPERTLRALKNRLGDQAPIVLDSRPYPAVQLTAALLRSMYDDSVRQLGSLPREVRLTHPATWNRPMTDRLLEAAAIAGLPNPALVPEPVAAALSFATEVGVDNGAHVAVYDLGGGTFDTAVVTANGGGFTIVGRPGGDQTIGGELFDEMIVNHLGEQLPAAAWDAIQVADGPMWQQVGATLRHEARKAKETLSGSPYAALIVPLPAGLVRLQLTRDELERMIRPYIDETVVLLDRCVRDAGLGPGDLAGISLVGGASRSPIVEQVVTAAFPGVAVVRRGDPKTVVATGAVRATRTGSSVSPETRPVSSPPAPLVAARVQPNPSAVPNPAPVVTGVAPLTVGAAPPQPSRRGRAIAAAAMMIVLAVVVGAVLANRSNEETSSTDPVASRAQLKTALLTADLVRSTLGVGWALSSTTSDADPFCGELHRDEPLRSANAAFSAVEPGEGTDGGDVHNEVRQTIDAFASDADATSAFERDARVPDRCTTSVVSVDGASFTYTISDATDEAGSLGRELLALRYEYAPTAAPDDPVSVGYVVETRVGSSVVAVDGSITGRAVEDDDLAAFLAIAGEAFEHADEQL